MIVYSILSIEVRATQRSALSVTLQVRSLQMQVRQLAQGAPAAGRRLGEEILCALRVYSRAG